MRHALVRGGQLVVATLLVSSGSFALPPAHQTDSVDSAPLFRSLGQVALHEAPYAHSRAAVRERFVELNLAAFDPALEAIDIDLFDGKRWRMTQTGYEVRGPGDYTWRGRIRLEDGREGTATLSVRSGLVAGLINTPDGTAYEIQPQLDGRQLLAELDHDKYQPCGEHLVPAPRPQIQAEPISQYADDGSTLDIMVVYTDDARAAAGGTAQIEATVQSAVDLTNTAYANSQIVPRLRLVHTSELAYTETGDVSADLNFVTNDPTVAALRNQYGADLVSFIVETSGYCGVGWLMTAAESSFASHAFNVVLRTCAAGNLTLAHEAGHNQGCNHDPANSGGSSIYPYAYGHFVNGSYRTIMSYTSGCTSGCPKAPHFSNPAVSYAGQPTGIANQRDNHQTINNTASTVANFRASIGTPMAGPTNLGLSFRGKRKVTLTWADNSDNEAGFYVYRWNGTDWVQVASAPADAETVTVTGLKPGKRYTFVVRAYSGDGDLSTMSNQLVVKTKS